MKRKCGSLLFCIGIIVLIILSGCASWESNVGVVDKTVPLKDQFAFYYPEDMAIDIWDGKNVEWNKGNIIILPAGTHMVGCRVDNKEITRGSDYTRIKTESSDSVTLTYVFEAGHYYTLAYAETGSSNSQTDYHSYDNSWTATSTGGVVMKVLEISSDDMEGKFIGDMYVGREGYNGVGVSYTTPIEYFYRWDDMQSGQNAELFHSFDLLGFAALNMKFQQGGAFVSRNLHLNLLADLDLGLSYPLKYSFGGHIEWCPVYKIGFGLGGGLYGHTHLNSEGGNFFGPYARGIVSFKGKHKNEIYFDYFFENYTPDKSFTPVYGVNPTFRVGWTFFRYTDNW